MTNLMDLCLLCLGQGGRNTVNIIPAIIPGRFEDP